MRYKYANNIICNGKSFNELRDVKGIWIKFVAPDRDNIWISFRYQA